MASRGLKQCSLFSLGILKLLAMKDCLKQMKEAKESKCNLSVGLTVFRKNVDCNQRHV